MQINSQARKTIAFACFFLALAVAIGAFGAHGLKKLVDADKLVTFETAVRYHFFHGFALLLVGVMQQLFSDIRLKGVFYSFLVGTLLFSFNCYLYVLTGIKTFAMIVPVGGFLFIIGWILMGVRVLKLR